MGLEFDHVIDNPLARIAELERRLELLERAAPLGLFESGGTTMDLPGQLDMPELDTESLRITDAGSAGATEQDWIEVEVGGYVGYLRVFAAK